MLGRRLLCPPNRTSAALGAMFMVAVPGRLALGEEGCDGRRGGDTDVGEIVDRLESLPGIGDAELLLRFVGDALARRDGGPSKAPSLRAAAASANFRIVA